MFLLKQVLLLKPVVKPIILLQGNLLGALKSKKILGNLLDFSRGSILLIPRTSQRMERRKS